MYWSPNYLDVYYRWNVKYYDFYTAPTSGSGKSSVEAAALRVLNLWIRTFIAKCAL